MFKIKNLEEITRVYSKSEVLLLTLVFEKIIEVSNNEFGINPLFCFSLPAYAWQGGLKYTGTNLETVKDKEIFLLLENNIRRE